MKRRAPFVTAALLLSGCIVGMEPTGPTIGAPPTIPFTPPPLFALTGRVRDEATGLPVSGAQIDFIGDDGAPTGRRQTSALDGQFRFEGVSGTVRVRVAKLGYGMFQQTFTVVAADLAIEIVLRLDDAARDALQLGVLTRAVTNQPPCDPIRWDAMAPCRRFVFQPASTGMLRIGIQFAGEPLDATIVDVQTNDIVSQSRDLSPHSIALEAPLQGGGVYEIRVNSYYAPQEFELEAAFL